MANFIHLFFGPLNLDKQYCHYFQYMSMISLVSSFLIFLGGIFAAKKLEMKNVVGKIIYLTFTLGMVYFQNRLLYTMCLKNVHGGVGNEGMVNPFII